MYTKKLMDHFMNPRNVGVIENPDGYAKVGSPSCGDMMEIFLRIEDEIIVDAKFRTFGCASAIASSSVTTEMILDKTIGEALGLTNKSIAETLDGLPASKLHCSVLAEEVINAAIEDYTSRKK
jgi:nitrogen fixation protein NifU and related proteins